MIQRIQSIFLLLAAAAAGGQFAVPYLSTETTTAAAGGAALPTAFADGVFNPFDNPGLIGLCALTAVVSLVAIFLYGNRPLQQRIAGGALACGGLLLALALFSSYNAAQSLSGVGLPAHYQAGLALPLVSVVFQWLASRSIRKDEAIVRSMDRLR